MSKDIRLNIKIRKRAMPIITELQDVMGCSPTEVLHQLISIYGPRHLKLLKAQSEAISLEEVSSKPTPEIPEQESPPPPAPEPEPQKDFQGITDDDFFLS